MAAATSTTTDRVTATTTLTVRVPRNSAGDLLDGAESYIARTPAVSDVTVDSVEDLTPRPGTLHATVNATVMFDTTVTTAGDARDALADPVAVEDIKTFTPR